MTPEQADAYNNEFYYDMDGNAADIKDILEWQLDEHDGEIPPEGTYWFDRKENRLEFVDDNEYYFYR